jgi:3-oxoacyl-[acyl-carrier-protein] synthase II
MYARRIVITGLGAVTPIGNDVTTFWASLLAARSGVAAIRGFKTGEFPPAYAAEVKDFTPERTGLPRKKLKMMGRHAQLALAAAAEASAHAGLNDPGSRPADERIGVMFGVGMLNADVQELGHAFAAMREATQALEKEPGTTRSQFDMAAFCRSASAEMFPLWLLRHIPNMVSAHATIMLAARAPSNTITTGCVAAANALGEAARIIERGEADIMFVGGTDARVSPLGMLRYRGLGWLATRETSDPATVSAPFDRDAAGFINGEGAGVVVLEAHEHARARGARILAELACYGAGNDAYDSFHPHPEGRGLARAVAHCLEGTEKPLDEIGAVFAPAPSVPCFDRAIRVGLETVFHSHRMRPAVTATRSVVGHTHAASCALDVIAATKALNESVVPPTINLRHPIVDFDFVTDAPRRVAMESVLVAACGFGGQAAALMLRRCEG